VTKTFDLHCRVCRKDIDICAADGSALWCRECCEDHDFEYCPDRRGRFCNNCDAELPYEPSEGDVQISFSDGRPASELGTPISKLSGRPGHEGFAEFCRIAKSWGYD
jgi:hypothetical protein